MDIQKFTNKMDAINKGANSFWLAWLESQSFLNPCKNGIKITPECPSYMQPHYKVKVRRKDDNTTI